MKPGNSLHLYRILYSLIKSLALFIHPFFSQKKWALAIKSKTQLDFTTQSQSIFKDLPSEDIQRLKPFWIHASSGEFEYAKPVLREIKKKYPQIPILVTYSSPSAIGFLSKCEDLDFYMACPWDQPTALQNFLSKWNPRALLISRTDAWPEMIYQTFLKKIPSLLFSATFSKKSSRLKGLSLALIQWSFPMLSQIFVVHKDDQSLLSEIANCASEVCGDTRYDQVLFRLQNQQSIKNTLKPSSAEFVFIAGSTWPEDEAQLFSFFAKNKNLKVILAPHEIDPEHLLKITQNLARHNLSYCLYSKSESWNNEQILIVDKIGILAELYPWAKMAFVGGSFVKNVHSVMEPLAAGLPVVVGPFHQNNREAVEFSKINCQSIHLVTSIENTAQLEDYFQKYRELSREQQYEVHQKIKQEVQMRGGATDKIMSWVKAKAF